MSFASTSSRHAPGWQLILADLALILFLVTLAALAATPSVRPRMGSNDPQIAAAQALYRPDPEGPSLAEWLATQQPDPRATLTIMAQFSEGDERSVWEQAQNAAGRAAGHGFAVRVVITKGEASDIYASLAYDTEVEE